MSPRRSQGPRAWAATATGALLGVLAAGCESTVYDRYDAAAWPDRRARLPTPDGGGPVALLTDNGDDTLAVVDLNGPSTLARLPIGLDPLASDGPHHLAVDDAAGVLYVALAYPPPTVSPGPHSNHGMSTSVGILARLSLADLRPLGHADTEANPGDVVVTPDGARVLVSHYDLARGTLPAPADGGVDPRLSDLIIYDAPTLARRAVVPVCIAAHGMVVSADSHTAYVACYGSDQIAVVSLNQPGFPVERIFVGPGPGGVPAPRYGPYALSLSPDGAMLYVSDVEGKDVRVFDVAAHRFLDDRATFLRAAAFFPTYGLNDATLLVPTQAPDGLVAIRRDTMEIVRSRGFTRAECQQPHQAARSPDGRYYVVCEGDRRGPGALLQIDPTTLETLGRTEVGVYPDAIVFTRGGAP